VGASAEDKSGDAFLELMTGKYAAVASLAASFALGAFGQTQVQVDNTLSTEKSGNPETPEANPARPTVTNPAHIPPVGYVQLEQGFVEAHGSPGLASQTGLSQTTVAFYAAVRLLHIKRGVEYAQKCGGSPDSRRLLGAAEHRSGRGI
jgi:hypothetical protein